MIKKEMSHILGRDIAHETLSETKKIDAEISAIKRELEMLGERCYDELSTIKKRTEISQQFLSNECMSLYCREKTKKPRVLICGFYGAKNVGDELMLKAILEIIPINDLDVTILLSNNYELDASEYVPLKVLHYPKYSSDIVAIAENFDAVIWGGGAMLDDLDYIYRGQYSTMTYCLMAITKAVLKKGGQAFIYGVSSNDSLSDKSFIDDLNYVIRHSDYFSLRDTNSLNVLKKAKINVEKVKVIDDISIFGLRGKELKMRKSKDAVLRIGLNLIMDENRLSEYKRIIEILVNYFKKPIKLFLIPFYNYADCDKKVLKALISGVDNESVECELVEQPNNIEELLDIYGQCDYIFAMRYHAALVAALMHKRAVVIDFKNNHRHYPNKNSYIKAKYVPGLLMLEYDNLCKNGIMGDMRIPETGITSSELDRIADGIEKEIQVSLGNIRRL